MRYLSLFSGIEAASAAWGDLGWECAAVAEVEPFPCAALAHHHPGVPNLGDVTKITEATIQALGHIDLVVFGSPCQDLSVAGQRKGLINEHGDITRSGLFFTAINIFHWSGARFALWENVPGAFSSGQGRDFASVVSFMAGLDDVAVPPNGWGTEGAALGDNGLLEWGTLDAQWFGVAQRRRRVFAFLDTGDWAGRPPILLEPESLRGDSAPRREKGQIAPTIPSRSLGGGGLGTDFDCDGGLVTHSLRGEGFDASEDGTGRGTPLVPVAQPFPVANTLTHPLSKGINSTVDEGQTPVLAYGFQPRIARNGRKPENGGNATAPMDDISPNLTSTDRHAVAFAQNTRDEVRYINGDGSIAGALAAEAGMKQQTYVALPAIAFNCEAQADQLPTIGRDTSVNDGLTCSQRGAVATATQVRRLTPRECERLQGFPDDHTLIPYRNKPAADGPRYKALGNSMAVPVMRHIGLKIMEALWN